MAEGGRDVFFLCWQSSGRQATADAIRGTKGLGEGWRFCGNVYDY